MNKIAEGLAIAGNVLVAIGAFVLMFDEWMRAIPGRRSTEDLDSPITDGRYR